MFYVTVDYVTFGTMNNAKYILSYEKSRFGNVIMKGEELKKILQFSSRYLFLKWHFIVRIRQFYNYA